MVWLWHDQALRRRIPVAHHLRLPTPAHLQVQPQLAAAVCRRCRLHRTHAAQLVASAVPDAHHCALQEAGVRPVLAPT